MNKEELTQRLKELEKWKDYKGEDEVISSLDCQTLIEKEKHGQYFHFTSGLSRLDKLINNFREGQLIVVSAETGNGKTTLCQTFTETLFEQNINALWFSYEVGMEEFLAKFSVVPIFYLPKVLKQNSMMWLEAKIIEGIAKYDTRVIFIDHLHYLLEMQKMAEAKSLSLLVGQMMRELKQIARKHEIIIFLVSHMKKTRTDDAPTLDDLRDSSFIAQESDIVMFIRRLKDGEDYTNKAKLWVAKNRRTGNLGHLTLELCNGRFIEVDDYYTKEETTKREYKNLNF